MLIGKLFSALTFVPFLAAQSLPLINFEFLDNLKVLE
jgi:hypothetical protein